MISGAMAASQMVLSPNLRAVLSRAVVYAFDAGSEFVQPEHLRRAMHDDNAITWTIDAIPMSDDPLLSQITESIRTENRRGAQIVDSRDRLPDQLHDPDAEHAPFPIYRSLFIPAPDGKNGKWLDQDSYNLFLQGARTVRAGAYLAKHLAKVL